MINLYHYVVLLTSVYLFLKVLFYSIYEIKEENNKYGGIATICFTFFVILFTNIIIFIR